VTSFPCRTCGEDYEAAVSSVTNPTAEDIQALFDAQDAHIAAHHESLKNGMTPDPIFRKVRTSRRGSR
jgi:hypothetical protein